jgi:SAM-dependent methyltransferase
MSYTFGDNEEASRRLRHLASIYEPETRALLELSANAGEPRSLSLAIDLGCGPGWSTQLLASVLQPQRTVGLDSSQRYIAEARANYAKLEFFRHDILRTLFPVESPDLFLCCFLMTHLPAPRKALQAWAEVAAPQAILLIHETEGLESPYPALHRYYELVAEMQRHYGQTLNVGTILEACFADSGWKMRHSRAQVREMPAQKMALLHLANLRSWGRNEYAAQAFDRRELDELEEALDSIASGSTEAGAVRNASRQIAAERV